MTLPMNPTLPEYRSGTVTVIRDPVRGTTYQGVSGRRMQIYTEDGKQSFAFDIAPREIEFGDLTADWATLERAGAQPLLLPKGGKLQTIKFTTKLTHKYTMYMPQESSITDFRGIARTTQRVLVRYSRQEYGAWYVTDASLKSEIRDPVANNITRAEISMTLTEAPATGLFTNPNIAAGNLGAFSFFSNPSIEQPTTNGRTWIDVQPGDTLQSIALRAYGNVGDWPWVYRLNTDVLAAPFVPITVTRLRV